MSLYWDHAVLKNLRFASMTLKKYIDKIKY